MLSLLIELLRSGDLPELAIGSCWFTAQLCFQARPAVGPGLELGVLELGVAHLRDIGSPTDWIVRASLSCVFPLPGAALLTPLCVSSGLPVARLNS